MSAILSKDTKWLLDCRDKALRWSQDPSTQVACMIVRPDGTLASQGYNGFPKAFPKVVDNTPFFEPKETSDGVHQEWLEDRSLKYPLTIHAELNAVIHAYENLQGCTAYIWPCLPCPDCASMLSQAGIVRVVCPPMEETSGGMDLALSKRILKLMDVELVTMEI